MRNYLYDYDLSHIRAKGSIAYYMLGAFITDGCMGTGPRSGQSSISSCDKDWLELIRQFVCPKKPIYTARNCHTLTLSHPEVREFFIENECVPRKSLTVKMPNVPNQYLSDFLRGCIDGDGCITIDNSIHCELSTASVDFAKSLVRKLSAYNPKMYCQMGRYYKVRFNGAYAYKLLKMVYYDGSVLSMPRKQKSVQEAFLHYERHSFNPEAEAVDIEHQVRVSTQSGSNNGASKLTDKQVIRILRLSKTKTTRQLMKMFSVSKTTINSIKSGRKWKHLTNQSREANTPATAS